MHGNFFEKLGPRLVSKGFGLKFYVWEKAAGQKNPEMIAYCMWRVISFMKCIVHQSKCV